MNETPSGDSDGSQFEDREWYLPEDLKLKIDENEADHKLYVESSGDKRIALFLIEKRELFRQTRTGEISQEAYDQKLKELDDGIADRRDQIGISYEA